jgi:alginate O-acetyltransferase complex protein AlgI
VIYSSYQFIFLFPTCLTLFYSARTLVGQNRFLLVCSIAFLAAGGLWNLLPVTLVIGAVALYWFLDRLQPTGRWGLAAIITFLLVHLAYFKYRNVLSLGMGIQLPVPTALLFVIPLGISFYTFEAISAAVDLRRRKTAVGGIDWPLFIMFFPHLIAGPIIRFHQLKPQFESRKVLSQRNLGIGLQLFTLGFIKKLTADPLGQTINPIWNAPHHASAWALLVALVGFYVQLFLDFSGYTDMGRGIARMMGFRLPVNFRAPYFAASPSEFYQRWHITLSNWIRVFLFDTLSLAVLRRISRRKMQKYGLSFVVLIVMALFGLWHGGAWHYVLFGVTQGLIIVGWTTVTGGKPPKHIVARIASILILQLSWAASLTLFRANDVSEAGQFICGLISSGGRNYDHLQYVLAVLAGTLLLQGVDYCVADRPLARVLIFLRSTRLGMAVILMFLLAALWIKATLDFHHLTIGLSGVNTAPFIYFNF